jgi:hypothetical protein
MRRRRGLSIPRPLRPSITLRSSTWARASTVCAVRRVVVSLLQAGGTEERFLGDWHIWRGNPKETKHARKALESRVLVRPASCA